MLHRLSHHNRNRGIRKILCSTLLVLCASVVFAGSSQAATISVMPSPSKVSIGNIVTVKVAVSTLGKSINNADAVIAFPTDMLEVLSISKAASIFSLWVEEPKFSNFDGKISFTGGLPSPGYIGDGGEIASITFKAKKAGSASVVFLEAAVRENNGLGTDILTAKNTGTIVIDSGALLEVPAVTTSANTVPAKPVIVSTTHSQQDSWYSGSTASFSWRMTDDVTSIQTLLGKSADSTPTVTYDSTVTQRTVNNLVDGVFYFHLRYQNSVGWSPVAHYKIQVDSTPPERFAIQPRTEGALTVVRLDAVDALSGIDSYSIEIDGSAVARVKKESVADGLYTLPVQNQGERELTVVAYDKAGNTTEARARYTSPRIVAPSIELPQSQIITGHPIEITGMSAYPQSPVTVFVQFEGGDIEEYAATTGADGSFSVDHPGFKSSGSVVAWAQMVFTNTIKSPASEKVFFEISDTLFVRTSKRVAYTMLIIIALILLLIILMYVSYLGWHKFFGLRRRIGREVDATVSDIHKAMMTFRQELGKQLAVLERMKEDRALNKKEEKIFKELQNNIDSIDDFIEKKLKKIR
ncbi:MAG: hypothetical protein KBC33_00575 [Candidatus Pacebacteria bacterium]|nr:hypothetical protein [Candidatus Paceibacterota bacterium]